MKCFLHPISRTFVQYVKQWGKLWQVEEMNVAECEFGDVRLATNKSVHKVDDKFYPFGCWGWKGKDFNLVFVSDEEWDAALKVEDNARK